MEMLNSALSVIDTTLPSFHGGGGCDSQQHIYDFVEQDHKTVSHW